MHGSFIAWKVFTHWHILDSCGSYNNDKRNTLYNQIYWNGEGLWYSWVTSYPVFKGNSDVRSFICYTDQMCPFSAFHSYRLETFNNQLYHVCIFLLECQWVRSQLHSPRAGLDRYGVEKNLSPQPRFEPSRTSCISKIWKHVLTTISLSDQWSGKLDKAWKHVNM